jgi:hypothetical protein
MKKHLLVGVGVTVLVVAGALVFGRSGKPGSLDSGLYSSLVAVPVLELPQTAAQLVAQAADKEARAVEVVRAVATMSQPDMLPFVVSAICRVAPEVAATTAATAVSLQPNEALPIAQSALTAAPAMVGAIVEAVCRQSPQYHSYVALLAAQEVPAARYQILLAVSDSVPALAPHLELAKSQASGQSLGTLLRRADELAYVEQVESAKRSLVHDAVQKSASPTLNPEGQEAPHALRLERATSVMDAVASEDGNARRLLASLDRSASQSLQQAKPGASVNPLLASFTPSFSAPIITPITPPGGIREYQLEYSIYGLIVLTPGTPRTYSSP